MKLKGCVPNGHDHNITYKGNNMTGSQFDKTASTERGVNKSVFWRKTCK